MGIFFTAALGLVLFFKPTPEYPVGQLNPAGYQAMGMATSILMLISMAGVILTTKRMIPYLNGRILSESQVGMGHFFKSIRHAFTNKDYRAVVLGYLFTNLSSALVNTIGLHVFTYTFSLNSSGIAMIIGAQILISILSQPVWAMLSDKMEKRELIKLGLQISIVGCLYFMVMVFFRNSFDFQFYHLIPFSLLAGFGTGGLYTLPQSMIADTVDVNALEVGMRQEGVFFGCMTLSYKLSQSVAIFLLGFVLELSGFNAELGAQSPNTGLVLGLVLALGGILFFVFAYWAFKPYSLDRDKVNDVHRELQRRIAEGRVKL
jgi:glycoside/pentoside/hexuronide:cation symporter, GPH family